MTEGFIDFISGDIFRMVSLFTFQITQMIKNTFVKFLLLNLRNVGHLRYELLDFLETFIANCYDSFNRKIYSVPHHGWSGPLFPAIFDRVGCRLQCSSGSRHEERLLPVHFDVILHDGECSGGHV